MQSDPDSQFRGEFQPLSRVPIFGRRGGQRQALFAAPPSSQDEPQKRSKLLSVTNPRVRKDTYAQGNLWLGMPTNLSKSIKLDAESRDAMNDDKPLKKSSGPHKDYKFNKMSSERKQIKDVTNLPEDVEGKKCFSSKPKLLSEKENNKDHVNTEAKRSQFYFKEHQKRPGRSSSPRIFTLNIMTYKDCLQKTNDLNALFEIFGILDSTVSAGIHDPVKRFNLKDESGILRCTFWEIDRSFPPLRRATMLRVVGKPHTGENDVFHCISIRQTSEKELQGNHQYYKDSEQVLKKILLSSREC